MLVRDAYNDVVGSFCDQSNFVFSEVITRELDFFLGGLFVDSALVERRVVDYATVKRENMEQTQATELQTAASLQPRMSSGIIKFVKDCISGTVGGVAVVAVGHPFGTH